MSRRSENPDGSWVEEYTGSDLQELLGEGPVGECSACHRKTWEPGMIGRTCYMSLPSGGSCAGVFRGDTMSEPTQVGRSGRWTYWRCTYCGYAKTYPKPDAGPRGPVCTYGHHAQPMERVALTRWENVDA